MKDDHFIIIMVILTTILLTLILTTAKNIIELRKPTQQCQCLDDQGTK